MQAAQKSLRARHEVSACAEIVAVTQGKAGRADVFGGIFCQKLEIGAVVRAGDIAGEVDGELMKCTIGGVLRGILANGTPVFKGMKSGDVDPRCKPEYCTTASDKALAVGGGVLEAVLNLSGALRSVSL